MRVLRVSILAVAGLADSVIEAMVTVLLQVVMAIWRVYPPGRNPRLLLRRPPARPILPTQLGFVVSARRAVASCHDLDSLRRISRSGHNAAQQIAVVGARRQAAQYYRMGRPGCRWHIVWPAVQRCVA